MAPILKHHLVNLTHMRASPPPSPPFSLFPNPFYSSSTRRALLAGLNLEMPGTEPRFFGKRLLDDDNKEEGGISDGDLREAARPILEAIIRFTALRKARKEERGDQKEEEVEEERRADLASVARKAATDGIVLLKNDGGVLPLFQPSNEEDEDEKDEEEVKEGGGQDAARKTLLIVGVQAKHPTVQGGGSSRVTPPAMPSYLDAIESHCKAVHVQCRYESGPWWFTMPVRPNVSSECFVHCFVQCFVL